MPDQDHARTGGNVPVIGNVQQQLFENLPLNPGVKNRDQRREVCVGG